MADMDKVVQGIDLLKQMIGCGTNFDRQTIKLLDETIELLKEQKEIKERFIEAFNTIRDAYNAPANREKILLNYLARNACCCEQKILIDSGQFADMPTMQSAT